MHVTAEIRWFWPTIPADLKAWFCDAAIHGYPVSDTVAREDAYLRDSPPELGIKRRGDCDVEIKGLIAVQPEADVAPFIGPIHLWCKWATQTLTLIDPLVLVTKRRWLRRYDTSGLVREVEAKSSIAEGCNVEYTELSMFGYPAWFTFGFEAFGGLALIEANLRSTMVMLATRQPPLLNDGACESYPTWLSQLRRY